MRVVRRKPCRDCRRVLTLRNFYRHPDYRDGRMNTCVDCKRQQARETYELKHQYYRAQQSRRSATPAYRAKRAAYAKTARGREVHRAACRRYRRFKALEARA